jgi:hypothetical protein
MCYFLIVAWSRQKSCNHRLLMTGSTQRSSKQGQAGVDPVAPTVEHMPIAEPIAPTTEELPATGSTSRSCGVHDEGDPANVSGSEEAWTAVESWGGPTRAGTEAVGDTPSSAVEDLSATIEQATPAVALVAKIGLGRPIRAQQQPRRAPLGQLL